MNAACLERSHKKLRMESEVGEVRFSFPATRTDISMAARSVPAAPAKPAAVILIAGNKEAESLEILKEGLQGLPARIEIYGSDYVYNVDYIAERLKKLIEKYRGKQKGEK